MAVLMIPPYLQFFSPVDGLPLAFGTVETYAAGTTTPKAAFSDQAGTIPLTNPINLDAEGMPIASVGGARVHIWVDGSYKYIVKNSAGVPVDTVDNVTSFVPGGASTIDINGLTANTAPALDDSLPTYDVSATANRKLSLQNLLGLIGPMISGWIPSSFTGTSTTASLSVSPGSAVAVNGPTLISGAGYTWLVSNGNNINGYQGGTTLPNTSTIHFFACYGSSGTGVFASTSVSPTLPSGYNLAYRRVFSARTDGAGALLPYTAIETEGGSIVCYLTTPVNDFNTTVGVVALPIPVSVPADYKHQHIGRYWQPIAATSAVALYSPDETDVAPTSPGSTGGNGYDVGSNASFAAATSSTPLITNVSSQIRARASNASTTFNVTTRGWKDFRRS